MKTNYTYDDLKALKGPELTDIYNATDAGKAKPRKSPFNKAKGLAACLKALGVEKPKKGPPERAPLVLAEKPAADRTPIAHHSARAVMAPLMARKSGATLAEMQAVIVPKPHPHTHKAPALVSLANVRASVLQMNSINGLGVEQVGDRFRLTTEYVLAEKAAPKPKKEKPAKTEKATKVAKAKAAADAAAAADPTSEAGQRALQAALLGKKPKGKKAQAAPAADATPPAAPAAQ